MRRILPILCLGVLACPGSTPSDETTGTGTGSSTSASTSDGAADDGTSAADTSGDADSSGSGTDTGVDTSTTDQQLAIFYAEHGGRDALPEHYVLALEALLYAQDEIEAGDRAAARARIDGVFEQIPLYADTWDQQLFFDGSNIGHPVAYYGLRMLDQVLEIGPTPSSGTLDWTVVVAPCADVTRPTLPDLEAETVPLDIAPEILADDGARLFLVTQLVRRWMEAITGGLEVQLTVHTLQSCTTVDYTDDGSVIVSYPDAQGMVAAVPDEIADRTDLWWVVAPSGVPGDGSGYDRHFITGGMGGVGSKPLFLSDDAWFTRKPEHLGSGAYTEAELRAYQPQWFQHEFMHHVFRTWPQFGLEDTPHQWFDRSIWPEDFEGRWEPDYYYEAIAKRLLDADPSLADGLSAPEPVDPVALGGDAIAGSYERAPVENGWHSVTVSVVSANMLTWSNAAGASWSLELRDAGLWSGEDCPYGVQELDVEADGEMVTGLWFGGERYGRTR